jgi:putative endonuclease
MGVAGTRGRAGEALAIAYLELTGCRVIARNVRLGGVEVDALLDDGPVRVVVEVKVRGRSDYGGAAGAVDHVKRARLVRAARVLQQGGARCVRIDVLAVDLTAEGATVRHVRNAVTE